MSLEELRSKIDAYDDELLDLLVKRMSVSQEIGSVKKDEGIDVLDKEREIQVIERLKAQAQMKGLDPHFVSVLFEVILDQSKKEQK